MKRLSFLATMLAAPTLVLAGVSAQSSDFHITDEGKGNTQGRPARTYTFPGAERDRLAATAPTRIHVTDANGHAHARAILLDHGRSGADSLHATVVPTADAQEPGRIDAQYDQQGRLVRRTDGRSGSTDYVYHPRTGKLILVLGPDMQRMYRYDDCGRVIQVDNSDGLRIELSYMRGSRKIARLIERQGEAAPREFALRYNEAGKPTQIELVGAGTVHVRYDQQGEIKHVQSPRGERRTALQITQAFGNLLRAIKVTGIDGPL